MSDKVVDIGVKFSEAAPVEVDQDRFLERCRHEHFVVDDKLRTVACADCREERLDPIECLITLARGWKRWKREAEALRKLRADHEAIEVEKWERAKARHLNANPDHTVDPLRSHWPRGSCRICGGLEIRTPQSIKARLRSDTAFDNRHLLDTGP